VRFGSPAILVLFPLVLLLLLRFFFLLVFLMLFVSLAL